MEIILLNFFIAHVKAILFAVALIALYYYSGAVIYIPNNRVGLVEKLFSSRGSVKRGLIALNGEAGYQPDLLRGGWHLLTPFIYRVHKMPLVTISQGQIGYVFARDGEALNPEQTLAANVAAWDFEDARGFLHYRGQKGPQRKILREGTYAINLMQFVVLTQSIRYGTYLDRIDEEHLDNMAAVIEERNGFVPLTIKGCEDVLAVITTHDGQALAAGEIIAPIVGADSQQRETYHNNFQDIEAFIRAGGRRGRQLQVLVDGTYYINRLFATVEIIPKTVVDVGYSGVVVSYTGSVGQDLSGSEYKHGELVTLGDRGVWETPLLPGKYAFNTYAGKVIMVPTTNFILKWKSQETGQHMYDENLAEVSLITKDAFEPSLPLSVVVHIDYRKAPLVIQRFGDIKRLVEQTLDPMVSAYFKNVAQTRTVIELIHDRSEIQEVASREMKSKFNQYSLELQEVLIGTPSSGPGKDIEDILTQLRARQIAEEQVETYIRQEKAADKERELREAEARARQQQVLTESEISIDIQANEGKAEYQRSLQQAAQIRALAEAEAERAARVGIAQALAIEEQVRAYGGPQFQVFEEGIKQFAQAIEHSGVDVVPKIVIGGANGGSGDGKLPGAGLIESLLALLLSEKLGTPVMGEQARDPQAQRLRDELQSALISSK